MPPKRLIYSHKIKVHSSLDALVDSVRNCSDEVPLKVVEVIEALNSAMNDNVLYAEEYNTYLHEIKRFAGNFKRYCVCEDVIK